MKILMTSETYLPRIGGAEVHVENLISQLNELDHSVLLVTNESGAHADNICRIPWSKKNILKLWNTLYKSSCNVDVIHSHYCHRMALLASIIGRIKNKPVFITLHGMGILDHPGAGPIARFWHSFYRYWSLKLCTHVISTSDDLAIVADRFISRDKMTIIFNGYNEKAFFVRDQAVSKERLALTNKKIIMTVRRLVPKNGPHYLIEALPKVLSRFPNVHYLVIGDGPLKQKMKDRTKQLNVGDAVTFLGMQDNEVVPEILAAADVVVFPSTAESSSIACAEAMAMQKSIVASRVGGLVELLGTNQERGWLVDLVPWTGSNYDAPETLPENSYDALSLGIIEALSDKQRIRATAAQRFAQDELSWSAVVEKTIKVYRRFQV